MKNILFALSVVALAFGVLVIVFGQHIDNVVDIETTDVAAESPEVAVRMLDSLDLITTWDWTGKPGCQSNPDGCIFHSVDLVKVWWYGAWIIILGQFLLLIGTALTRGFKNTPWHLLGLSIVVTFIGFAPTLLHSIGYVYSFLTLPAAFFIGMGSVLVTFMMYTKSSKP